MIYIKRSFLVLALIMLNVMAWGYIPGLLTSVDPINFFAGIIMFLGIVTIDVVALFQIETKW